MTETHVNTHETTVDTLCRTQTFEVLFRQKDESLIKIGTKYFDVVIKPQNRKDHSVSGISLFIQFSAIEIKVQGSFISH